MNIDAEEEINRRSKNISREDIEEMLGQEDKARTLSEKAGFLSQYWEDIKTSFSLIRDWFSGAYEKVPTRMVVSLVGAILYFLSPLDIIPDWIPMAGFIDDAAILAFVFKLSEADLKMYRCWKRRQAGRSPEPRANEEPEELDSDGEEAT